MAPDIINNCETVNKRCYYDLFTNFFGNKGQFGFLVETPQLRSLVTVSINFNVQIWLYFYMLIQVIDFNPMFAFGYKSAFFMHWNKQREYSEIINFKSENKL